MTAYRHSMDVQFKKIRYFSGGSFRTGDEEKDYGYYHPIISFDWYCKNGEWVLSKIFLNISDQYWGTKANSIFEDW